MAWRFLSFTFNDKKRLSCCTKRNRRGHWKPGPERWWGDKALIGNSAYRHYLRATSDATAFEIDPGKLADEARYDGLFVPRWHGSRTCRAGAPQGQYRPAPAPSQTFNP